MEITVRESDIIDLATGLLYCAKNHKHPDCHRDCPYERQDRNAYCQSEMKATAAKRLTELLITAAALTEENERLRDEFTVAFGSCPDDRPEEGK